VGDYVIVHVGFALNKLDEENALKVLEDLKALEIGDDSDGSVDRRP
jgi:hydrogenase maturation factor